MTFRRLPDFGRELKRPFAVAEQCYDCASFYDDGCNGWRASQDFGCRRYSRLPDVMPGACGQTFPPSPRWTPASPALEPVTPRPTVSGQTPTLLTPTPAKPQGEVATKNGPTERPALPAKRTGRICGCGARLPKGRRLCDTCRTENRRQTKRGYMRRYMKQWRSAAVHSGSDVPFPAGVRDEFHQGRGARRIQWKLCPQAIGQVRQG